MQASVVPLMATTEAFDSENEFNLWRRRSQFSLANINCLIQHKGIEST